MQRAILATIAVLLMAAAAVAADEVQPLADRKVSSFAVGGEQLGIAVSRLASTLGVAIGQEAIAPPSGAKATTRPPRVSLSARDKTVRQVLDALVAQDKSYSYSISDDFINLFPASTVNDPTYVYNRRIPGKVVVSTDPEQRTSIRDWLHQNKLGFLLFLHGDIRQKPPVPAEQTVTLVNPTLREHANWAHKLSGYTTWSVSLESLPNGKTRITASQGVLPRATAPPVTNGRGGGTPGAKPPIPLDHLAKTSQDLCNRGWALYPDGKGPFHADGHAAIRRQRTVYSLRALELLLDYGVPDEDHRPPPTVLGPTVDSQVMHAPGAGSDPRVRKYREDIAALRASRVMNELWGWRKCLTENIVSDYVNPPSAPQELRALGREILSDPVLANKLGDRVEAQVAKLKAMLVPDGRGGLVTKRPDDVEPPGYREQ